MRSAKGLDAVGSVTSARDALQPIPALGEYPLAGEPRREKAEDSVTMEQIEEAGREMVAAQRGGDKAQIQAARNAYRALRDQAEREENEHYVAVKKAMRNTGAEKEHQSMLRAMRHGPGAKDSGILDHPLAALAALLGILIAFRRGPSQGERNQEANYDLRQYRPKPKEW